ncbi:class I SAM-dependent methyltransferase [Roseomonas sp. HF4]|uniref:methyltransferase domain-containing protein n=1 Tax=Roseomonas sp. HF4 TaxID=2562313 RepID=UPI0010C0B3F9|nr:class I SAM-dependent methyltransferase [Roseomonas sp. HF4]
MFGLKKMFGLKRLPAGFDPNVYLDLNPDVRAAKMDAAKHYLRYGRREGRPFVYQDLPEAEVEAVPPVPEIRELVTPIVVDAERRRRKIEKLRSYLRTDMSVVESDGKLNFLTEELRELSRIEVTENVSSHAYVPEATEIIDKHKHGLILDCGAGNRSEYLDNVVNFEIVDYASTDVLGVGERLPFKDNTFDAVLSNAVLEHVRNPFLCAKEMIRVLKPGGDMYCVYPLIAPVHGYPNHYFNATPQGLSLLFEEGIEIKDLTVIPSTHPLWALRWILAIWKYGLPEDQRQAFSNLKVSDLLDEKYTFESLSNHDFCRLLPMSTQLEISSCTMLRGTKRHEVTSLPA